MRIGIDLGGTKIEAVVMNTVGDIVERRRIATPQGCYQSTLTAITSVVAELESAVGGACRVGLATPGAIAPHTGRMQNCNSTRLNDQPLKEDLQQLLGREVRLANDADCMALSEARDGAASGAKSVFGVILGTGVGGGIVINGLLLSGPNAIAGEWGHNPLPWPDTDELAGGACYCGLHGCIETWLSGPGMAADYLATTGDAKTSEQLFASKSAAAMAAVDRYCQRLAKALASVINILDPEVVVLAGGLSNQTVLYELVPKYWQRYMFSSSPRTQLLPAKHGDASGVRGAAWLWPAT